MNMVATELDSFTDRMDRCWLEGRFPDLAEFLAKDVVFVAPGGAQRVEGLVPAIDSYRQFMSHAHMNRFETSDQVVTERGDTAVIEYRWDAAWTTGGVEHAEKGREVLVLARREEGWRVVWRTQIPNPA
jgi:ketosteroid isomerase-like protein